MTVEIRSLRRSDDRQAFRSGDESLDLFFHRYAGQNQFRHHIGVSYVAMERERILGFVTVSPASLDAEELPTGKKLPPYPVPVLRVGRLAVDASSQGRGVGKALLRFSIEVAEQMADSVGCTGVLVDAKADAAEFYAKYGFQTVDIVEGATTQRPAPTLMFLPLGSIPPKK